MKNKPIGSFLILVAMVFAVIETEYFGNNLFPISYAELFCDLICLVILGIGFYFTSK